jgi:putative Mn2+ efflux pump MntP
LTLLTIISIAVGLAMDCFAVAVSVGAAVKRISRDQVLKMASYFGGFQAGMTLLGWGLGIGFAKYVKSLDHWIAFGLLTVVGGKMLVEAFEKKDSRDGDEFMSDRTLLVLSVATSIDALAVGVGFSCLRVFILAPAIIIGIASFMFPVLGVIAGKKTGELLGNKAEVLGGLILIGMGIKILLEHITK